jgi:hypothetical protein
MPETALVRSGRQQTRGSPQIRRANVADADPAGRHSADARIDALKSQ